MGNATPGWYPGIGTQQSSSNEVSYTNPTIGGYGFSSSYIPTYSQTPILQSIAQQAQQMAPQVYAWGMNQYNKNQGNIDAMMRNALTYASPQRIAANMGMAESGVAQGAASGLQNSIRDLQSYGIDPSAGRYAGLNQASQVMSGAAAAGAGNQQRISDTATGNAMQQQAISSGISNYQQGFGASNAANALLGTASQLKYDPLGTASYNLGASGGGGFSSKTSQSGPAGYGYGIAAPSNSGPGMLAKGGYIPDRESPTNGQAVDDVPANLTAGEFVIPKDVVEFKGKEFFYKLMAASRKQRATSGNDNQQQTNGYARGGSVSGGAEPGERTVGGCNIKPGYSTQGYTSEGASCIISDQTARAMQPARDKEMQDAANALPSPPTQVDYSGAGAGAGSPATGRPVGYAQGGAVDSGQYSGEIGYKVYPGDVGHKVYPGDVGKQLPGDVAGYAGGGAVSDPNDPLGREADRIIQGSNSGELYGNALAESTDELGNQLMRAGGTKTETEVSTPGTRARGAADYARAHPSYARGGMVRRGYAGGGDVSNQYANQDPNAANTVGADTTSKWTPEAYQASLQQQYDDQQKQGYADGGMVRRGYDDGGVVDDSTAAADAMERRRRELEQQKTAASDAMATQRQQPDQAQQAQQPEKSTLSTILDYGMKALGISPAQADQPPTVGGQVLDPASAPAPARTPVATSSPPAQADIDRQAADAAAMRTRDMDTTSIPQPPLATGASRGDPIDLQVGAAGFPAQPSVNEGLVDTLARAPGQLLRKAGEYLTDTGPNRVPQNERIMGPSGADRLKSWLQGDHPGPVMSDADFVKLQDSDLLGDHSKVIHDEFQRRVKAGDNDGALALVQTARKGFDALRGVGQHALELGDTRTVINAAQRMLQTIPNGRNATVGQGPDGSFVIRTAPDPGYPGESREHVLSPHQMYDFMNTHGSQFDHLAHNGLDDTLDLTTGKKQPLYVPPEGRGTSKYGVGYDLTPKYTGTVTDSGLPTDSPAGLMERAETARQRGAVDKEATDYADRARAAVDRGVAPEQVHDFLRKGGDPYAQQGPVSGRPDVATDANGRPVYGPQTNIPGASSPPAKDLAREDFKTIGPGDTYTSREASARSAEQHQDAKGGGGSKSSSSKDTSYALYPESHFINKGFTPYNYGERRAGYRAPYSAEDARSMSTTPIGPPVPPGGVQPSAPSAADQVAAIRGGYANANAPPAAWGPDEARAYNAQLAGRQQAVQGGQDPSYLARREASVAKIAPQFAAAEAARNEPLRRANNPTPAEQAGDFAARRAEVERRIQAGEPVGLSSDQLISDQRRALPPARPADVGSMVDTQRRLAARENRPYTPQQEASDRAQAERMQLQSAKGRTAENVAGTRATSAENVAGTRAASAESIAAGNNQTRQLISDLTNQTRVQTTGMQQAGAGARTAAQQAGAGARTAAQQEGAGARNQNTVEAANQRAANVLAQRNDHLAYLNDKANQDRIAKTATADDQRRISVLNTKLTQGIKPQQDELDAYQRVLERGLQPEGAAAAPAATATPPGPARPGFKWQQNRATGEWRQAPG